MSLFPEDINSFRFYAHLFSKCQAKVHGVSITKWWKYSDLRSFWILGYCFPASTVYGVEQKFPNSYHQYKIEVSFEYILKNYSLVSGSIYTEYECFKLREWAI